MRQVVHDTRGLPYLIHEAFWITPGVIHIARCEGWVSGPAWSDDVDDRAVLSQERISLETVEKYHVEMKPSAPLEEDSWIEFTGGARRRDMPVFLVASHLNGGPKGYAASPPVPVGHITADGKRSPLIRVDVRNNDTEISVDERPVDGRKVRIYNAPGQPGIRLCGFWIDNQRQYGVAVYRDDVWQFSVPDNRSYADWVYDQIDKKSSS